MFLTYPSSFVDISFVRYEQPRNIHAIIDYRLIERSGLQNIGKKKKLESTVICKAHFLFCDDQLNNIWLNLLFEWLHSASGFQA